MRDWVGKRDFVIFLLMLTSCRSPIAKPIDVTFLTGERVCIDQTIEVVIHAARVRGTDRRPTSIDATLPSALVTLDHAPRSIVRPAREEVARWIERYPASRNSIDSGQLIWVNAALQERMVNGNRIRKVELAPGNGVWSLIASNIDLESIAPRPSADPNEIFRAECKRTDSHRVRCEREVFLGGIRATYRFSPDDEAIMERDQLIRRELGQALVVCR